MEREGRLRKGGRYVRMSARTKARLEEMCRRLLANTVIENYSIEVVG